MISIVEYGTGNTGSIQHALRRLGVASKLTREASELKTSKGILLPGVGSFDTAAEGLRAADLFPLINDMVRTQKVPILGICLGMQLMAQKSEEGIAPGFGWFSNRVVRFDTAKASSKIKIPNIGWNYLKPRRESKLLEGIDLTETFYFVHSYHLERTEDAWLVAESSHGYHFPAVLESENIFGVQFHPEKSREAGLKVLKNFASYCHA